ncbi:unnamed protein product [Colletotrichum noveboracense]|uniref:Indoleamine 2,3-dioxygenase n=1 Tax=Colletotrichum noveboracense TaxID=2664923 RepID=A0A9W4WHQ8_9PEZI|nr:unnamed protein product [Colletotrichum noveboracense]
MRAEIFITYFCCLGAACLASRVWKLFWSYKRPKVLDEKPVSEETDEELRDRNIENIKRLAGCHEIAAVLSDLVKNDGAGSWPPRANHALGAWPEALRPYRKIYMELAPQIPQANPSLDDNVNLACIAEFRSQFRTLLREEVDLPQVDGLLSSTEAGQWNAMPQDVYNAFYCCIASCRHAYRWATIPVVKVAQMETQVDLPEELVLPWKYMQRRFDCASDAGNTTSNLILNFDVDGEYMFRANTGMTPHIVAAEEAFARIFHETEVRAVSVYYEMLQATITWTRGDMAECARHVAAVGTQLRTVLKSYYDRMHETRIPRSVWLSRVQSFFAWSAGNKEQPDVRFNGLSGNQVLLFQALDAFLGLEPYLSEEDLERSVPVRQRALGKAFRKHSFRDQLSPENKLHLRIAEEIEDVVKRLRVFRAAHRTRSLPYLAYPAPERLPMTAAKSLLKSDLKSSLEYLDAFMLGRLKQTV